MALATFLNGGTATQLRGVAWLALSETGYLVTRAGTSDGGGGGSFVWSAGTAGVPCRVDPIGDRSDASMVAGRIDERTTHIVTVPYGTNVGEPARFAVAGRGTFEVTAVRERTAAPTQIFEVLEIS